MVESTKSELGALIYERFISEDGRVVYVFERYIDSPTAVTHHTAVLVTCRVTHAAVFVRIS